MSPAMIEVYLMIVAGIAVSVTLPIVRAYLPRPPKALSAGDGGVWEVIKPYVATAVFAMLAGLVVLAASDGDWSLKEAFIAGYLIDATLEKLTTGNASPILRASA